jgi:hypothetical protein
MAAGFDFRSDWTVWHRLDFLFASGGKIFPGYALAPQDAGAVSAAESRRGVFIWLATTNHIVAYSAGHVKKMRLWTRVS